MAPTQLDDSLCHKRTIQFPAPGPWFLHGMSLCPSRPSLASQKLLLICPQPVLRGRCSLPPASLAFQQSVRVAVLPTRGMDVSLLRFPTSHPSQHLITMDVVSTFPSCPTLPFFPRVSGLHLCSRPANRFICTISLGSIHMCGYTILVFLSNRWLVGTCAKAQGTQLGAL